MTSQNKRSDVKIPLNVVLNTVHFIDDTLLTDINKDNKIWLSELVLSETCISEYNVHATLNMKPYRVTE